MTNTKEPGILVGYSDAVTYRLYSFTHLLTNLLVSKLKYTVFIISDLYKLACFKSLVFFMLQL